jgi:hypothetical protein
MSSCRVPPCPSVRGLHEASLCAFLVACGGLMPGRNTARLASAKRAVMGRWWLYVLKSVCHHGIPHIRHTMRREFGRTVEAVWVTHVEHGFSYFGRCDAERLVFCGVGYGSHCLVCVCDGAVG